MLFSYSTSVKQRNLVYLIAGILSIAVSVSVFFEPNNIVVGGFSGFGIIINRLIGIPVSVSNIILNIPLFIIAYKVFGKKYILKSGICAFGLSAAFQAATFLPAFKGDITLISVYGALFDGFGTGLILRAMSSTGGVDLLAAVVHKKRPYLSLASIMFAVNAVIILLGLFVFGAERALYAVISAFISGKIVDIVLDGLSFSKAALIISDNSDCIAEEILKRLDRGVTEFRGKGMFTGTEKNVLLCVFGHKETAVIKEIVRNFDENAFVIVTDVTEVMGEGFKDIGSEG
ncbi:YitT family protein [Lachnospiraceae bacterium NSJ-143]|nr:YitT family protein [Lachnospiraceae bacterium NSJ-143]